MAGESPLTGIATAVRGAAGGGGGAAAEAQAIDPRQALTREIIEGLPNDLLLVDVPSRGATATLLRAGANGNRQTWISPDGISVTLEGGLIVATRGFGFDLMAADVRGPRAIIGGAAGGQMVIETLDGRDQVIRQVFDCTAGERVADPVTIFERSYRTTRVQVICGNGDLRFGNNYWVDGSGAVWKSQQFVTPELGYLGTEAL